MDKLGLVTEIISAILLLLSASDSSLYITCYFYALDAGGLYRRYIVFVILLLLDQMHDY